MPDHSHRIKAKWPIAAPQGASAQQSNFYAWFKKQNFQIWQRLEPRSRSDDFTDGISARISDPLWMLARQWQVGEFMGEDAGSPVKTLLRTKQSKITRFKPKESGIQENSIDFDEKLPLDFMIEREPLVIDFRMGIQIGQSIEKELEAVGADISEFIKLFPFEPDLDQITEADDQAFLSYFSGKVIDGKRIFEEGNLLSANPDPLIVPGIPSEDAKKIKAAMAKVRNWLTGLYGDYINEEQKAWNHNSMEYECCVSAPLEGNRECVMEVPEYNGNRLDWTDFSVIGNENYRLGAGNGNYPKTDARDQIYIPTNIFFHGMPGRRWWTFEDSKINLSDMDVKTTDVSKLLLMEFAFISGNDWFQIPVPLGLGALCWIEKLEVVDVFGLRHQVERAGTGDESWQRWEMFSLSVKNDASGKTGHKTADFLFFPPVLTKPERSPDLEEIKLLRDEMANKVWAVEHRFLNPAGNPQYGSEHYREIARKQAGSQGNETKNETGDQLPKYRLMSDVPEYWIPYVPVHSGSDRRAIVFKQAGIIRSNDDEYMITEPLSRILKSAKGHSLNEETVCRSGLNIKLNAQRTRWADGSTPVWLGRKTSPGRGEGSSGLRFDFTVE